MKKQINMKKIRNKLKQSDITKINNAYHDKVAEYEQLSLDEMKALYPSLGGTYKTALEHVVIKKLQEEKTKNLTEAINDIKVEDAVIINEPKNE